MDTFEISSLQEHLRTWHASITSYQAEHWSMQTRGNFNKEHMDKIDSFWKGSIKSNKHSPLIYRKFVFPMITSIMITLNVLSTHLTIKQ